MNINAYCKFIHRFLKCNFFRLFFNDNLSTAAGYPFSGGFSVSLWIIPVCLHVFCRNGAEPVPDRSLIPSAGGRCCARAPAPDSRCLYVHEIFSMRDATACPTDCCPPAARFLPCAARCLPGRLPPTAGSRGGRRCLAFLALRHPHCSRLLPAVPASSCCSRLFRVVPAPPPPRAGTPRKSNGASVVRMRRRWGICLPLFGEFPGSPASVGLGPQP